jgi:hypothetical protein
MRARGRKRKSSQGQRLAIFSVTALILSVFCIFIIVNSDYFANMRNRNKLVDDLIQSDENLYKKLSDKNLSTPNKKIQKIAEDKQEKMAVENIELGENYDSRSKNRLDDLIKNNL